MTTQPPSSGRKAVLAASILLALAISAFGGPLLFEKEEYAARRTRLMDRIPDGAAVIFGAKPPAGYFPFVQSNDFRYLCGVEVPDAVLIVDGKRRTSMLFMTLTERAARNDGIPLDLVREPVQATGIESVLPADRLTSVLAGLAGRGYTLYTPFFPEELARECSTEKWRTLQAGMVADAWDGRLTREVQCVKLLRERLPAAEVKDCSAMIWEQRAIKSAAEVEVLRKGAAIAVRAYREVLKAVRPGMPEYELAALFEYHCKKEGARDLAYYIILCSAENHPYVHYYKHDRILQDGDFVVMDAGPDLAGYDIDITVSFPVNGKFTPRQKEIYEACLAVHEANLSLYRPGLTVEAVRSGVAEILQKKGHDLKKDSFRQLSGGFGHYVGLAVHDVGGGPAVLKPGMVFANEPLALYPAENLGVRIEDTVLVTESGCENLTDGIPRSVRDIEEFMRKRK
jgi:Xaa-Pro aminopeptidase